ncbi:hypothetical protein EC9_51220 [Rosistilla ulvae]|uniref:Outer membrane protein transport protein (OMPP1/FadL/TodX) n=1 Tax=Rosistilla ulvae TaxID=1930277 RepID=A0A517M7P7_9BACT|nr:BBP7 family outer membrane beta-barrel protein [Rosistilla ulvae]QDS90904.1 hypothetical protein EC9_51220 [Rosistilla ulvae]
MNIAISKLAARLLQSSLLAAFLVGQSYAADQHVVFATQEPFAEKAGATPAIAVVDYAETERFEAALLSPNCDTCGETSCGCDSTLGCDSLYGPTCGTDAACLANGLGCGNGWLQAEYLMWWSAGMPTPALLARASEQNPAVGTPLVGGSAGDLLEGMRSGLRVRGGTWLDNCQTVGIEFEYLFLDTIDEFHSVGDNGTAGSAVYTRPFFNVLTNQPDAELVSFPGVLRGTASVQAEGDFQSAGVRLVWNQCQQCCEGCGPCGPIVNKSRFDLLIGYRYASLDENLLIRENLQEVTPPETTFDIFDQFTTTNRFNGGELGVRWQEQYQRFSLEMLGKLAFGSNRQTVQISGRTLATDGIDVVDAPGGLLAQTSNIGTYTRNRFALIPELGATVGYAFRPNWKATLGYSIIYWDRVVRPGDQIDTSVNPNLLPPATNTATEPLRPEFQWQENGFWTQGISFGLAYNR